MGLLSDTLGDPDQDHDFGVDVDQDGDGGAPVTAAQAVAGLVPENVVHEGGEDVAALIRKWIDEARVPSWLKAGWERWKSDRKYLSEDLFAGDSRTLTVNLAARLVESKLTQCLPTEADLSVRHERGVGDGGMVRRDAIRKAFAQQQASMAQARSLGMPVQLDPAALIKAADDAEQDYQLELEAVERFAATCEAVGHKQFKLANATEILQRAGRGAFTTGIQWIKVGWERDYRKDSTGRRSRPDSQDQLALLALRAAEFAANRFGRSDPQYAELEHLSRYARAQARKVLAGWGDERLPFDQWAKIADTRDDEVVPGTLLPEPETWQQVTYDIVPPENMRWDWGCPIAQWREAGWFMEQVLMTVDQAAAKFGLTPAEKERIASPPKRMGQQTAQAVGGGNAASEQADPERSTFESPMQNGKVVVWDRWDAQSFRHCLFIEGLNRLLVDEVPDLTVPWFFPYVPVFFNLVDGAHLPISEVRFIRKVNDAINQRLTDGQESLWASMKRYLVKQGSFRAGELEKLRGSQPHDVIEVEDPQGIKEAMREIASDDWNPEKYNLDQLFRLLELVSGVSLSQLGVVNVAKFATEAAISNQSSQENDQRHAIELGKVATMLAEATLTLAVPSLSEKAVRKMVRGSVYWPVPATREDLMSGLGIRVDAAGSREQATAKAAKGMQDAMAALGQVFTLKIQAAQAGMELDETPLVSAIFKTVDLDMPVREVLRKAPMQAPQQPGLPGGQMPGPGAQGPQDQPPQPMPQRAPQPMPAQP
jgi:hypothetical protein